MFKNLPEPIQDILGNPRYKFTILIVLSLLAVFFIYSGDASSGGMLSSLHSYLPELLATGSVVGSVLESSTHANLDEIPVDVNIDMLAPF